MAALENVVNRFIVDYYSFLALELFQNEQYADFRAIRDILKGVLVRPVEDIDDLRTKILVLNFLSRIHEGERLGTSFESDQSVSPLESALTLLDYMNQEYCIPQQDLDNACASLKEMMVLIFIKNSKFDKAKEALDKYFPKPMVGKKAIFMGLIRQKCKTHKLIDQMDFKHFKDEMLAFCQRLRPFRVPFLLKAAKQLLDRRLTEPDNMAAEEEQPGPSSSPQINANQFVIRIPEIIQRSRLKMAYKALATDSDEKTFAQVEDEVERDKQLTKDSLSLRLSPSPTKGTDQTPEEDGIFQRNSGSPMEASPADQPPHTDAVPETQAGSLSKTPPVLRNRRLYTVAQLVVEPDSQGGSQCTPASQGLEVEVRTEETPQAAPSEKDQEDSVTDDEVPIPTRKRPRRARKKRIASTSLVESTDSEEPSGSVANGETCVEKVYNSSLSRNLSQSKQSSSDSEEDPQEAPAPCTNPVQEPQNKKVARDHLSKDAGNTGDPQTSLTPHKDSAQDRGPSHSKWKRLYNNAKESKETWSDEELYFTSRKKSASHNESIISNSDQKKRNWTESETNKLKEGVKKFGEGNWSKIQAYYSFKDRTNINLKDRWRTLKKLKMV